MQVGIDGKVDAGCARTSAQHGVGKGNAQRIEAQSTDLVESGLVAPGPQTMKNAVAGLEPEPIDSGDAHRPASGIDDLIAAGGKKTGCHAG